MDTSISLVTPEMHFDRGYAAHGRKESIDGHNMNPGVPAIADWQRGWIAAQIDAQISAVFAMGCPP